MSVLLLNGAGVPVRNVGNGSSIGSKMFWRCVTVPDDASGVLQDPHWAAGAFGYFPSYALGCLIAAQLWERLESDVGSQDEALRAGDVAAIRTWLAEQVHRHGRRLDTVPLVERVTARGIEVEPFLRWVS